MSLNRNPKLIQIINEQTKLLRRRSTKSERILWEELRNRKFLNKKFYRQHPVIYDLLGKETFYVLDFYCHENKVAIELDGEIHKSKVKEDKGKDDILNKLGIRVIRFENREVEKNTDLVLRRLKEFILESP